jgi:hypothetical protein
MMAQLLDRTESTLAQLYNYMSISAYNEPSTGMAANASLPMLYVPSSGAALYGFAAASPENYYAEKRELLKKFDNVHDLERLYMPKKLAN